MQSTDSMQSLSHYQWHFSHRTKRLRLVWKQKLSLIAKATLRKKNGTEAIRLPDFKLLYKAIVIKTVWYWQKNKKKDYKSMEQDRKSKDKPTHLR